MTNKYKNSTQPSGSIALVECPEHPEICKEDVPSVSKGSCNYYQVRYDDYQRRHASHINKGCCKPKDEMHYSIKEGYSYKTGQKIGGCVAPDYYLNYGLKYCTAFKEETYEELSYDGKGWLLDVLKNLQIFMEKGVVDKKYLAKLNVAYNIRHDLPSNITKFYTGIECRNDDFRDFAFATHPDAYNPKVMQTLPCSDLILIANTPAYKEWMSGATWEQAIIMGKHMNITDIMLGCLDESSSYLADKTQDIFEDLAEKFTRW